LDRTASHGTAIISAIVWFTVEVTQHPPYSHEFVPVWNGLVRLVFFLMGVGLVRSLKKTETHLLRQIIRRTRTLRAEADRRRQLERELEEVTAREHLRFAQDLHDGLGQYLSALAFHARILSDDLHLQRSPHASQAERIVGIIRTMNHKIRRLDRAMRVPELTEGGLPAAIRSLVEEFEQLTGVPCDVELAESMASIDPYRALMLLRIVQEAMNNAVKHGSPHRIKVSCVVADGMLHTRVANDGAGLPPQAEAEAGSGLRIMKLRAELIGSQLSLRPNGDKGCVVECILPHSVDRTAGSAR
jgi:signal transduction histidine kinase